MYLVRLIHETWLARMGSSNKSWHGSLRRAGTFPQSHPSCAVWSLQPLYPYVRSLPPVLCPSPSSPHSRYPQQASQCSLFSIRLAFNIKPHALQSSGAPSWWLPQVARWQRCTTGMAGSFGPGQGHQAPPCHRQVQLPPCPLCPAPRLALCSCISVLKQTPAACVKV